MKNFIVLILAGAFACFTSCKKSSPAPAPGASSDRKITLSVDKMTPVIGSNVTFTLVAGNSGPDATTNISVGDLLPAGYDLVSATATTGTYTTGTWAGFGLASGASATLTIVATVKAAGSYTNTATITGSETDPTPANNSATVTPTPTAVKLLMVSTLAGSTRGYLDATGAAALFSSPRGLGVDAAGNVYVTDYSNNCIRKISPAGVVTTLAGSTNGNADGTGTSAKFNLPNSLAVDAGGNVYVADASNNLIRKITPAGVVTTLGTGSPITFYQPLGVAVDGSGNVYVADTYHSRICKISSAGVVTVLAGSATGEAGYADGSGAAAKFDGPNGVVVDAGGNLYVSDGRNFLIRKISPAGVVSTLAGSTEGFADGAGTAARFEHLSGPSIDAAGNIYIADIGNNRVRMITPGGVVSTVAGGPSLMGYADGPVATAQFQYPYAVAVDAAGTIYISDYDNNVIRKIGY